MPSLETLIAAMDQAERRYFTVQAQRQVTGDKNSYLKLFQAIAADKSDEELRTIIPANQLATQKHYLYQLILKAMRNFESGKSKALEVREIIQEITFLERKGLLKHCRKLHKKALALATRYERFAELLSLLDFERRWVKLDQPLDLGAALATIEARRRQWSLQIDRQYVYVELYDRLFSTMRQQLRVAPAQSKAELQALLDSDLLRDAAYPLSFQAKSYFWLCRAFCLQLLGQFAPAHAAYAANIAHWEADPERCADEPHQYQRALSNYLAMSQILERWELFPAILARMQGLRASTVQERAEHFSNYFFYQFNYCLNRSDFEAALQMAPKIEAGLQQYGQMMPESRKLAFNYNLSIMLFFLGQYKAALKWLHHTMEMDRATLRQDAQRAARILLLILHYELGNYDLEEHLFGQVQHYLKKAGLSPFERLTLTFLRRIYRQSGLAWPRAEASQLIQALEELSQASSDAHYPGIRECIIWLCSKNTGSSMVALSQG
jgi:hypothetical protein